MSSALTYRVKRAKVANRPGCRSRQSLGRGPKHGPSSCGAMMPWLLALLWAGFAISGGAHLQAGEEDSWERRIEALVEHGRLAEAAALAETMAQDPGAKGSAYGWLGRVSMAGARFEEAARHFGRARELGENIAAIADPWSRALVKIGRRPDACMLLDEAASAAPRRRDLRYRAGTCYLELGAPRRALPHLAAAHRDGLSHSASFLALARAQFGSGREDLAADLLADMTKESFAPGVLLGIGRLLFRNVLYRQALAPLRKAWQAKPGWYDAGMYLALAHYQLEEYEDCLEILAALEVDSRPAEYRNLLGSVLGQLGEPEAARREFESGILLSPRRADSYLNLGLFLLDRGRFEDAIEVFERGAKMDARGAKVFYKPSSRANCHDLSPPSSPREGAPIRTQYFLDFADSLLSGQQWAAALVVYQAALAIDPKAARPYAGIALVCQELGTAEAGLEFARRGVQLHPDNADLHYYLGSLHEYLSEPAKAIDSYQTALRLGGAEESADRYWLRLGIAQVAAGKVAEAESSYRMAVAKNPGLAEGHFRLGKLHLRAGRYAEAEALFERAVSLDPFLSEAAYSWGLALVRNGRVERGREVLEAHRKKAALRKHQAGGME